MNAFVEYKIIGEISSNSQCAVYEDADAICEVTGFDNVKSGTRLMIGGNRHILFIFEAVIEAISKDVPYTLSNIFPYIGEGKQKLLIRMGIDKSWVNENPNWTSRILENKRYHDYFSDVFISELSESEILYEITNLL